MQVADSLDVHVDPGVPGEQIEHVVEEADPGRHRSGAAAVKIDCNRNVGFLGGALYCSLAHTPFFHVEDFRPLFNSGAPQPLLGLPGRVPSAAGCGAAPGIPQRGNPDLLCGAQVHR
jgi:hypothetical protein